MSAYIKYFGPDEKFRKWARLKVRDIDHFKGAVVVRNPYKPTENTVLPSIYCKALPVENIVKDI